MTKMFDLNLPFGFSKMAEALGDTMNQFGMDRSFIGTEPNEDGMGAVISIDLPGVKKEDVELSIVHNTLQVAAVRKGARGGKREHSFTLSKDVDRDDIGAKMEDGVLYLTLKRIPESTGKKIDIG